MGSKNGFLTKRLKNYSTDRNNPLKPSALSGLSPYLHFGQISAQRCALEARAVRKLSPQVSDVKFLEHYWLQKACLIMVIAYHLVLYCIWYLSQSVFLSIYLIFKAVDTFLEELIVRRELADNFCYYQPHYDSLKGAWEWARKTLMDHASDKREHLYT